MQKASTSRNSTAQASSYATTEKSIVGCSVGLCEEWSRVEELIGNCTIITTEANDQLRPSHPRMPVVIQESGHVVWLDALECSLEDFLRETGWFK